MKTDTLEWVGTCLGWFLIEKNPKKSKITIRCSFLRAQIQACMHRHVLACAACIHAYVSLFLRTCICSSIYAHLVCVWIHWSCCVSRLRFSIFFFFFFVTLKRYCSSLLWTVAVTFDREQCICALFMDPQITLFNNFFIKNGSHGTIHTF